LRGAYPNALFHARAADVPSFVGAVNALQDTAGYTALRAQYGVLRYSPALWQVSDRMHAAARAAQPLAYGFFDFNRLQAP
jgi:acyl-homoserine lactone acylase PvdQ